MTSEDPRVPLDPVGSAGPTGPTEPTEPTGRDGETVESPPSRPARPRRRSTLREYFEALLIAVIFATFARTYVVQAFKIPTGSMEENLLIGDHILVNKFLYGDTLGALDAAVLPHREVRRGDVVVFRYPEDPSRDFIKRCVGLPGDKVELMGDLLYVNEQLVDDASYAHHVPEVRYRERFGPMTVGDDEYFCLGDNRDNSRDSRAWGGVPASFVKGRAFLIYWSYDGGRQSLEWPGYWGKLRQLAEVARGFFTNTRWSRSFKIVR